MIARGKQRLEAARREIQERGGKALALPADVADPDQVERAAEQVESELGPIDVWVAIYAQDLAPGLADWYLGTHGYDSQQTLEPVPPGRPDNLFEPVEGDYAAHGIFTAKAKDRSVQNWINLRRAPLAAATAALIGVGAFLSRRRS